MQKNAFSLVELSIVLVILGLLVGGILGGKSLIRAAELRSASNEFSRYVTASYTFRDKYFGFPGDISNATSVWGDQATGTQSCASAATADGSPGTCNGNADGYIGIGNEMHRAWQQLAFAGLIEGSYTGQNGGGTGCGSSCDSVAGTNVPMSRIANGGYDYTLIGQDPVSDAARFFSTVLTGMRNTLTLGAKSTNFFHLNGLLTPEEAWNIDTKIDDGQPQYGRLWVQRNTNCTTTNSPTTAAWYLTQTSAQCTLFYGF